MDTISELNSVLAGRYEVEREIGAGGMATVYLARDVRHNRSVALKLLKPELGAVLGVERFLSEIQVTANLQHPNLLPLFDSGEANGKLFYVMPYVEGESLRVRLEREKQLPVEEAVRITIAIGNALAYAHQQGVIHRDLKPENVLLQAGQPVIADFGIALAVSKAGGARVTQTGLSLGTPQYMSPEQATGDRAIDGRTDVYSLAAMLYEMLTGDPPHTASTAQGIIAKVLTDRPRTVRTMRSSVPVHIDLAIEKALEKLPADRWASAQEFVDALQGRAVATWSSMTGALAPSQKPRLAARLRDPWVVGPSAVALAAIAWVALVAGGEPEGAGAVPVRFTITASPDARVANPGTWATVPSPDGRLVVYSGEVDGITKLFIRYLDQLESRVVPGTDGATQPIFSPDGRWLAYLADGKLKKVLVAGGTPVTLASGGANNGADWINENTIVLGSEGAFTGLSRVNAAGGPIERLTVVDTARGEKEHLWPVGLSDGKTILLTIYDGNSKAGSRIGITSLDDPRVANLDVAGIAPLGVFGGELVYAQEDGSVMAVPFDVKKRRITGTPVPVLDSIPVCAPCNGDVAVRASRSGAISYLRGSAQSRLVWVDRNGAVTRITARQASFARPRLSPDGRRIAVAIRDASSDIWIYDVSGGTLGRLTSGGNDVPIWIRNGNYLVFASNIGMESTFEQPADGSRSASKFIDGVTFDVSPDDKYVLLAEIGASKTPDIMTRTVGDSSPARPFLATDAAEIAPRFSPDGRWVAYASTETGVSEVYVREFADNAGRVQISDGGGHEPVWSRDGRELFYRNGRQMMVAGLAITRTVAVASRDTLFAGAFIGGNGVAGYDVSRDGRFVMVQPNDDNIYAVVVTNWLAELKQRTGRR